MWLTDVGCATAGMATGGPTLPSAVPGAATASVQNPSTRPHPAPAARPMASAPAAGAAGSAAARAPQASCPTDAPDPALLRAIFGGRRSTPYSVSSGHEETAVGHVAPVELRSSRSVIMELLLHRRAACGCFGEACC
jgi:hypothetical protein